MFQYNSRYNVVCNIVCKCSANNITVCDIFEVQLQLCVCKEHIYRHHNAMM